MAIFVILGYSRPRQDFPGRRCCRAMSGSAYAPRSLRALIVLGGWVPQEVTDVLQRLEVLPSRDLWKSWQVRTSGFHRTSRMTSNARMSRCPRIAESPAIPQSPGRRDFTGRRGCLSMSGSLDVARSLKVLKVLYFKTPQWESRLSNNVRLS